MGKKLAIKGHPTRGKEVIGLLKMLGGINKFQYNGSKGYVYFIEGKWITLYGEETLKNNGGYIIYELEEFLEKYPFKVGDKVVYTKYGDNCDDYPVTIESMKWTGTTIEYAFDDYVTCLAKDLKVWNEEPDAVISGIHLNSCDYADEVELNLGDYEIKVRNGKTYAVLKKPKYPTTYAECCEIIHSDPNFYIDTHLYSGTLETLYKLLICRNAYWKIAGKEMGLDKPWNPDWKNTKNVKYGMTLYNDIITKIYLRNENAILAFPTEEMQDAFYENFKDLIEQCKELL